MHQARYIIPQNPYSLILKYEDGKLKEEGFLPVGYNSATVYTLGNYFTIDKDNEMILIFNKDLELFVEFPNKKMKCIAEHDGVVYFGGYKSDKNKFPFMIFDNNFTTEVPGLEGRYRTVELNNIDLPVEFKNGKAIDDISIVNNKVILFDNIIYPKYVIEYEIDEINNLEFKSLESIPAGTYETIKRGIQNEDWRVILSNTVGRNGAARIIKVSGKKTYTHCYYYDAMNVGDLLPSYPLIKDIALLKDTLYLLLNDGLYEVDLNDYQTEESPQLKRIIKKDFAKMIVTKNGDIILYGENEYEIIEQNSDNEQPKYKRKIHD